MKIRIKYKLFFTLLLTSAMVAAGLFLFLQWNFDRGFLSYINSQEQEQLHALAGRLTDEYAKHENWQFMSENHALWQRLYAEVRFADQKEAPDQEQGVLPATPPADERYPSLLPFPENGHPPRPDAKLGDGSLHGQAYNTPNRDMGPPPPSPGNGPRGIGPRVVLFDSEKQRVIGGPSGIHGDLKLLPVTDQSKIIGYLGLVPLRELANSGDLLFVEQQIESFALVTLVMVALSLLLSFPITSHLLRPINELTRGTRKLIAGKFKTRIPVTTGDELGQLSDHFNILAMTLEKNERARQQWVADISHELRTPLAILRGEVEALQDGVRQPEPQTIGALHGEIMHLERLVSDLYELSMSDIGALTYKKIVVDPVGLLQGTIELFEDRFNQKGLKINADFPQANPCPLLADPDRLQQLFTNLLENSLRYTDAPGTIEISMAVGREAVSISLRDSAPGVPPAILPKLFDRLFRGEGSRNRGRGGAGLGLAICKNIVDAHQGRIEVDSSPLGGLLVMIELPLSSQKGRLPDDAEDTDC